MAGKWRSKSVLLAACSATSRTMPPKAAPASLSSLKRSGKRRRGPGGNSCQRKAQEEDVDRVPCGQQPQGGLGRLPFRAAVPAALEEEPGRVGPRRDERPEEQSLRDNAPRPQEL